MSEGVAGSSPLVVVDPVRLAAAAQECRQVVEADWPEEDRRRVDYLYAAGLRQLTERAPVEPGIMSVPEARAASLLLSMTDELVLRGEVQAREVEQNVLEATFDKRDPAWVRSGLGWIRQALKLGRFDWRDPEAPTAIPNDCRIAILGDWGTGRYGAPRCAASIEADQAGFDVVLHLGDVYYSGTTREITERFTDYWPRGTRSRSSDPVLFRACNSNHEMYAGGRPYIEQTVDAFGQGTSAFALENDNWLVVGLDTAYDEWDLAGRQKVWLDELFGRDDGRSAILLSHHQPMSHFDQPKRRFVSMLDEVLARHRGKVRAWYWGHEHLCAVYDEHPRWSFRGRCIGHGGIPYFRRPDLAPLNHVAALDPAAMDWLVRVPYGAAPSALVVDGPNPDVADDLATQVRYGPHGYATLMLDDDTAHEAICSVAGLTLWAGTI